MRAFKRLKRDQDGMTAVEFGMLSPVIFLLMMGITEIGLLISAHNILESATYLASRTGRTGYVADNKTQAETIKAVLEERASVLFDSSRLSVDSIVMTNQSYSNYDVIGEPEPFVDANDNGVRDDGENYTDINGNGEYDEDRGEAGAGGAEEVVVYTVTYPWQFFTPMIGHLLGDNGTFTIEAKAVVKNEPY